MPFAKNSVASSYVEAGHKDSRAHLAQSPGCDRSERSSDAVRLFVVYSLVVQPQSGTFTCDGLGLAGQVIGLLLEHCKRKVVAEPPSMRTIV